jgi:glycosyltransferase involved in cell wall biosynthesis
MKTMKKHNVLVDLKIAMNNGYCGIAKENRLIFKMLAEAEQTKTTGMLVSQRINSVFNRYEKTASRDKAISQANRFFHDAFNHEPLLKARILGHLKLATFLAWKKNRFDLYAVDSLFNDVIWRSVFDKSLAAADRDIILRNDFRFSDLTNLHVRAGSYFKRNAYLNTAGYDFAVFLEPAPVSVAPNTIKIVRYHDAIPITEPDFSGSLFSYGTINNLDACALDSWFVCNSDPTRDALLAIKPELESKTFMIPCAMSSHYKRVQDATILKKILLTRLSTQIVPTHELQKVREQISEASDVSYLLNLAALDPKKNHVNLIRAWEKLNYQQKNKIKLVISANSGRFAQEAEDMMRPHIQQGDIIHLNNISTDEIPYLFSHAQAFVFPSYTEGFGLPPLEAMQCECPTIVSDIPAHRWVMGDASLYCDPYSVDSIYQAMSRLCFGSDVYAEREQLVRNGLAQVKKYSSDKLSDEWEQVFNKIKA